MPYELHKSSPQTSPAANPDPPPTLAQTSRHGPGEQREERVRTASHPSRPSDPPPGAEKTTVITHP